MMLLFPFMASILGAIIVDRQSASAPTNPPTDPLHVRIAAALGWTEQEACSFSLSALRELVRPINPKLAHEIDLAIRRGPLPPQYGQLPPQPGIGSHFQAAIMASPGSWTQQHELSKASNLAYATRMTGGDPGEQGWAAMRAARPGGWSSLTSSPWGAPWRPGMSTSGERQGILSDEDDVDPIELEDEDEDESKESVGALGKRPAKTRPAKRLRNRMARALSKPEAEAEEEQSEPESESEEGPEGTATDPLAAFEQKMEWEEFVDDIGEDIASDYR